MLVLVFISVVSHTVHPVLSLTVFITIGYSKGNIFQPTACCIVNIRGRNEKSGLWQVHDL